MITRRKLLIALSAGAFAARSAYGQSTQKLPRIGILFNVIGNINAQALEGGLRELGYEDGRNVIIDRRHLNGQFDRAPALAAELLGRNPDVVFASNPYSIRAFRNATTTVPVVGVDLESDPVTSGFVESLARPGRNITGFFLDLPELGGKQIQFLREAVPGITKVGVLWDVNVAIPQLRATEAAAKSVGIAIERLGIRGLADLEPALASAMKAHVNGLVVLSSPIVYMHRKAIAEIALKHSLASISVINHYPDAGGLMAYGPDLPEMHRRAASHIDKILKGAKPRDLSVERPTKFELVINMKTAKALGLTFPQSLLLRADRMIE